MSGLNSSIIKSLTFAIPPVEEQKTINKYLGLQNKKINELMTKIELQIEKLQECRQAVISNAVTGKIKV